MSYHRGTETDRLLNVVQVLQLGRKTGRLLVDRGERGKLEEGVIAFTNGQIVDARMGYLYAQDALNQMKTWKTCRFTFAPSEIGTVTQLLPAVSVDRTTRKLPATDGAGEAVPARSGHGEYSPASLQRIMQIEKALHLLRMAGLSRVHLRLLLLVDGHRTPVELARLVGRNLNETQRLVSDLEYIGVIRQ